MDVRRGQGVGQAAAVAGSEGHGGHVVGGGEGIGAALIGDEAQVAAVHVGVADEGAEGPQAGGVEGGEGEDGAAAEGADAVEAFDFEKALALVVDDAAGGGGDAGLAQGFEGEVFGEQEVAPALGYGAGCGLVFRKDGGRPRRGSRRVY